MFRIIFTCFVFISTLYSEEFDKNETLFLENLIQNYNTPKNDVDIMLDKMLSFIKQNPSKIDYTFNGSRIFTSFVFNAKIRQSCNFDKHRLEQILDLNPNLNYIDGSLSLLNTIISYKHCDQNEVIGIINLLIKHGLDVNFDVKNYTKINSLKIAMDFDKFKIFKFLLGKGAVSDDVIFSLSANYIMFASNNNFRIGIDIIPDENFIIFINSPKFRDFNENRLKYAKEFFKVYAFDNMNQKEKDFYLLIVTYFDNTHALKLIKEKNIKKHKDAIVLYANKYKSKKILSHIK